MEKQLTAAVLLAAISDTFKKLIQALWVIVLLLAWIILSILYVIARILPYVVRALLIGLWIVMVFVTGWSVWNVYSTIAPDDMWTNALLSLVGCLSIALLPINSIFTKEMWGELAGASCIGVIIWLSSSWVVGHPELYSIVRLLPNIISVFLISMLAVDAGKSSKKEKEHV